MIARSALASSKLSPFLGAASLIAILFLVVIAGHAEADVGDSDRLGFLPGRSEWITRDLVEGTPISVCSSDFPNATRAAVSRWNAALGIIAFRMLPSANNCKTEAPEDGWNPRDGVDRVTVSRGNPNCPEVGTFCGDFVRPDVLQDGGKVRCSTASSRACIGFDHMQEETGGNALWRTYYGRAEIVISPTIYCGDIPKPRCHPQSPDVMSIRDLVHDIAHELGHVFGLSDYYCDRLGHPDHLPSGGSSGVEPVHKSLMNSWNEISDHLDPTSWCDPEDGLPTARDLQDYTTVYTPAAVTELQAKTVQDTFRVWLSWNQADVFVESGFEVQRKTGSVWHEVASVVPNATSAVVKGQPVEGQQYRVVARTKALPHHETHGHTHSPAEATVGVTVQPHPMLAPTNPRIVGTTVSSLTLVWTPRASAPSATPMFKVKYTTGSDCDAPGTEFLPFTPSTSAAVAGATDATVSYPLSNLKASTQYKLCVRSVREILPGFEYESDWASTTGTTAALPLPTSLTVRDVTDSKATLHWNEATGADGYEVQIDGVDVETTLGKNATSYEFTLPSADTAYKLGVAAKHGDQMSAFATLTLLKPPSSITQSTTVHNSVKYTWTDGNPTGSATAAEVKIGASGTRQTADSTTYHTFDNLSGSTEYTFYIRLKNDQGPSAWRTATVTTPAQPRLPKPGNVRISRTRQNSLTLSWNGVADAGGYQVKRSGSSTVWTLSNARRSHTFAGLSSNSPYTLSVKALPKAGSGKLASEWEHEAGRTLLPPPPPQQPDPQPLTTCLSSARLEAYANWFTDDSHCRSVRASALWSALRNAGIEVGCISRLILGSGEDPMWERYQAAGSRTNFLLRSYDILWLSRSACPTGSGVSGSSDAGALNCAEAVKPETGPAVVSVGGAACVIVRGGGAVQVSDGERTLNLTLSNGRDWVLFAASEFTGSSAGAFWVYDLTSGGWIALYPPDGFELERHTPADAAALPALLDAIAASAAPSVYPAADR